MLIGADANLQQQIIDRLKTDNYDVHIFSISRMSDPTIGRIANEKNAVVITNDIRTFLYENYKVNGELVKAGLVQLRLGSLSSEARAERVSEFLKQHGDNLEGKVVTIEATTERIKNAEDVLKDIKRKEEIKEAKEKELKESKELSSKEKEQNSEIKKSEIPQTERIFSDEKLKIDRISDDKFRITLPSERTRTIGRVDVEQETQLLKLIENPTLREAFINQLEEAKAGQQVKILKMQTIEEVPTPPPPKEEITPKY